MVSNIHSYICSCGCNTPRVLRWFRCSIGELVEEIQTRFQVSLKPGNGNGITLRRQDSSQFDESGNSLARPTTRPLELSTIPNHVRNLVLPSQDVVSQPSQTRSPEKNGLFACARCHTCFKEADELQRHSLESSCESRDNNPSTSQPNATPVPTLDFMDSGPYYHSRDSKFLLFYTH